MNGEFPLWPSAPPGALGEDPEHDTPTLTVHRPLRQFRSGAAIVVCPGGGYWELMSDYEGRDYALWLNERGITAFVLKYRLAAHGYHHPEITGDLLRAMRLVRARAAEWDLDPGRIGVMGSSAGGHLASLAMTLGGAGDPSARDPVERVSSRPDFGILCYAVISMELWTMKNLLGPNPLPPLIRHLSSDLQVGAETPPCFLWHTGDDAVVSAEHSLRFAGSLHRQGVHFALHIYPSGPHGLGLGVKGYEPGGGRELHPWTGELTRWLEQRGISRMES